MRKLLAGVIVTMVVLGPASPAGASTRFSPCRVLAREMGFDRTRPVRFVKKAQHWEPDIWLAAWRSADRHVSRAARLASRYLRIRTFSSRSTRTNLRARLRQAVLHGYTSLGCR